MKRIPLIVLCLLLILGMPVWSQQGTQHGVAISFTGVTSAAGYNIYRCPGTCTATSGIWTKIDTSLDLTTSYLDPSTNLTAGATLSYAATAVDASGDESAFSNVATLTLPSSLPTNPAAPSGCNASVK